MLEARMTTTPFGMAGYTPEYEMVDQVAAGERRRCRRERRVGVVGRRGRYICSRGGSCRK